MNLLGLRWRSVPAVAANDNDRREVWRRDALSLDYPHPRTRALIDELDANSETGGAASESTEASR
ncbi:hypothetical protein ACFV4K_17580 [Nocardia sp. NPDC059764]|uniref:hypothetical protein n=1 Tax=Nocardia sp. NPDC059764 TaxID=3346939 RepID=UPI003653AC9C